MAAVIVIDAGKAVAYGLLYLASGKLSWRKPSRSKSVIEFSCCMVFAVGGLVSNFCANLALALLFIVAMIARLAMSLAAESRYDRMLKWSREIIGERPFEFWFSAGLLHASEGVGAVFLPNGTVVRDDKRRTVLGTWEFVGSGAIRLGGVEQCLTIDPRSGFARSPRGDVAGRIVGFRNAVALPEERNSELVMTSAEIVRGAFFLESRQSVLDKAPWVTLDARRHPA